GTINHYGTRVAFTFAMTRNSTISRRWRVFRPWPEALALAMLAAALGGTTARAAAVSEPAGCRTVRLADVGWTDVTATTAVLSALRSEEHTSELQSLAYLVCRLPVEK